MILIVFFLRLHLPKVLRGWHDMHGWWLHIFVLVSISRTAMMILIDFAIFFFPRLGSTTSHWTNFPTVQSAREKTAFCALQRHKTYKTYGFTNWMNPRTIESNSETVTLPCWSRRFAIVFCMLELVDLLIVSCPSLRSFSSRFPLTELNLLCAFWAWTW